MRNLTRAGLPALAGVLLAGGPGVQAARHANSLIVPGKRIGQVELGADVETVYRRLGKPADSDAAAGNLFDTWQAGKYKMVVHSIWDPQSGHRRLVMNVRVTSPYFRTQNGIGVGSAWAQIRRAFPAARSEAEAVASSSPADSIQTYFDAKRGILFDVLRAGNGTEAQGRCVAVEVSRDMGE